MPLQSPCDATENQAEIQANAEVVRQLQDLESCFSITLTNIRELLTHSDLQMVTFFLDTLLGTDVFKNNCHNVDDVLRWLCKDYIDVFNIYSLEKLAGILHEKKIDELIKVYSAKKEKFLEDSTVLEFQMAVVSRVEHLPKGMNELTIRIPRSLAKRNLRTLKDIQMLATNGFGDFSKFFVNLKVKPGSIIIMWYFPKALSTKLEQLARENAAVFTRERVEEVTIGGTMVFPWTQMDFEKVWKSLLKPTIHRAPLLLATVAGNIVTSD